MDGRNAAGCKGQLCQVSDVQQNAGAPFFFGLHKYQKGRRICKKESRDLAWPTGQAAQSRDWSHNPGRLLCRVAGRDAPYASRIG